MFSAVFRADTLSVPGKLGSDRDINSFSYPSIG